MRKCPLSDILALAVVRRMLALGETMTAKAPDQELDTHHRSPDPGVALGRLSGSDQFAEPERGILSLGHPGETQALNQMLSVLRVFKGTLGSHFLDGSVGFTRQVLPH
jgi:hypothetical protein